MKLWPNPFAQVERLWKGHQARAGGTGYIRQSRLVVLPSLPASDLEH